MLGLNVVGRAMGVYLFFLELFFSVYIVMLLLGHFSQFSFLEIWLDMGARFR